MNSGSFHGGGGQTFIFALSSLLFGLWLLNNAGDSLRNHPKGFWKAGQGGSSALLPIHHLSDFHPSHCISVCLIVSCLSWVS